MCCLSGVTGDRDECCGSEHHGVLKRDQRTAKRSAAIAKPAVTWAESGSEREAVLIAMDLDELVHEVATLHGAMCLIGRMAREAERAALA